MHTKTIEYYDQETLLEGFIAYTDDNKKLKPIVLVMHDWSGRNEFACNKAKQLADLGYIGFAIDMYGKDKIGHNNEEKTTLMQPLINDRALLQRRLFSALAILEQIEFADKQNIAAIGFCFGGLCALDLARSGLAIKGIVSFHGLLNAPENLPKKNITAKILALHGYDDPMGPPQQVNTFAAEMTAAGADWQVHLYGNTVHAFTNPLAHDPSFGTVYNETAAARSWQAMTSFLQEIFHS